MIRRAVARMRVARFTGSAYNAVEPRALSNISRLRHNPATRFFQVRRRSRMRASALLYLASTLVLSTAAARAFAHHSFSAEFDADKRVTLTGTVTKLEWQNPHTWFYVDVKDDSGHTTNWGFELASPNLLLRKGWTRSALREGDVVTVEAYLAKNGTNNANAHVVTLTATGKSLFTGSSKGGSE
jgi:hypothetical protein